MTSIDGNFVFVRAITWHNLTRQLGIAPLEYNDVNAVTDGKITYAGYLVHPLGFMSKANLFLT